MAAVTERIRDRIVSSATSPFGHAAYPLARTLDHRGDPGLFGPDSVSWRVIGDVSTFVGGVRALLVQATHPEVVAGVEDHSRYRHDPLGRLSRTSAYVTATTYGAMPEVEAAVDVVRGAHRGVSGASHRGRPYAASSPAHAAWVHNVLTESFLAAYQAFAPEPLEQEDADLFVREQAAVGRLLDAAPLPETATDLARWVAEHSDLEPSPGMTNAVEFLVAPPLGTVQRAGYRLLLEAALVTIPARILDILDLRPRPWARPLASSALRILRWALGSSPSWRLALTRVGAPVPEGLFTQRAPVSSLDPEPG